MTSSFQPEKWLPMIGSDSYLISSHGRVKSLARTVRSGRGSRLIKEKILSTFACKNTGYIQFVVKRRKQNVHRHVAILFLGEPPFPAAQVNHKNGVRSDANVSNLEWVTASENALHAYAESGRKPSNLGVRGANFALSRPIVGTHLITGEKLHFSANMDAFRAGFDSGCISRCCNGLSKFHKGYSWGFFDGVELSE